MTADLNRLTVLLAGSEASDFTLIRRAFRRLNHFTRLVVQPAGGLLRALIGTRHGPGAHASPPAADVLILEHRSAVRTLRQLRQEQSLARLPVVVLSGGLSVADADVVRGLNAACCTPVPDPEQMAEALEEAICNALRLAWDGPLEPLRSAMRDLCVAAPGIEPIRVWT